MLSPCLPAIQTAPLARLSNTKWKRDDTHTHTHHAHIAHTSPRHNTHTKPQKDNDDACTRGWIVKQVHPAKIAPIPQQEADGKDGARAHFVACRCSLDDSLQEGRHNFRAVGRDAIEAQMLDQRHLEHVRRLPALLRDKENQETKRKEKKWRREESTTTAKRRGSQAV